MMRSAQNGSITLRYEVCGAGRPLLLLHPGLCDGSLWTTLGYTEALRNHFQLLIPDLRGHGRSNAPAEESAYTPDAMRDDIGAILDAEGLESAWCWGFSLGALLALRFAAAYPGRLRALIAGGAAGALPRPEIGTGTAARIDRSEMGSLAPPPDGDPAVLPLAPVIRGGEPHAHAARYRSLAGWRPPDGIDRLTLPLLLYGGEADSMTPAVQALAGRLPSATLITVPAMGHLQLWCHPELMLPAALDFLLHNGAIPG